MTDTDQDGNLGLLSAIKECGAQAWHNRGQFYAAPLPRIPADVLKAIPERKYQLIEQLRRHGFPPCQLWEYVAPCPSDAGSYAGRMARKPWDYECAVCVPTLGPPDLAIASVACWRNQTVSPYLLVIDTGSRPDDLEMVDCLRTWDTEVHAIRSHGWRHSSSPVAAALDLAFAVCQTEKMVLTHSDVFPKHYHVLEELVDQCSADAPVVGYRMSPRMGSTEWHDCPSHTLTCLHMPTMRAHRVTWNLLASLERDDEVLDRYLGWPDTETQFGRSLQAEGITPIYLGTESNAHVYETDTIVHWRSTASYRHYLPDEERRRHPGMPAWVAETYLLRRAAPLPAELTQTRKEATP